jgi:hypothetical protein
MLRPGWRACTPLSHICKCRCFANKVLGVRQGPQYSGVTVGAKLKADPCNQESKYSESDYQRLGGFGQTPHLIISALLASSLALVFGKAWPI